MKVVVIAPHGFCLGVQAALKKAEEALSGSDRVYALHALVHNEQVMADLSARGLRVVKDLAAIPRGARLLVSAHGTSPAVRTAAAARGVRLVDATCPFVMRAHRTVAALSARGANVVVIGHADHVEVQGLVGEVAAADRVRVVQTVQDVEALPFAPDEPVGGVCQTTLAPETYGPVLAALRMRYPRLVTPAAAEACSATQERQEAVRAFVREASPQPVGVLVLGSASSSNTRRLAEIAAATGARVWCAANDEELAGHVASIRTALGEGLLGITAGASTPESLVRAAFGILGT